MPDKGVFKCLHFHSSSVLQLSNLQTSGYFKMHFIFFEADNISSKPTTFLRGQQLFFEAYISSRPTTLLRTQQHFSYPGTIL